MKTTCSKCNNPLEENRINKKRYCLSCSNEWSRNNRKRHSELSYLQRLKANCRSYTHTYVKRGKIIKGVCEICGSPNVEAHHDDYTKPLEIKWLCKLHHKDYHKTNDLPLFPTSLFKDLRK